MNLMSKEISFRVSDSDKKFLDSLRLKLNKKWRDLFLDLSRDYVKNFNNLNAEQVLNFLISDEHKEEFKKLIDKILKDEAQKTISEDVGKK